jgi:hypothetical protein
MIAKIVDGWAVTESVWVKCGMAGSELPSVRPRRRRRAISGSR